MILYVLVWMEYVRIICGSLQKVGTAVSSRLHIHLADGFALLVFATRPVYCVFSLIVFVIC